MLTDYAEACRLVLEQKFDWGTETVPLAAAPGRTLAEPLRTDRPQPPFDRITMDGIAIDHAAYATGQRVFSVAGVVAAGAVPPSLTDSTTCLEVMTGAALPPGTTTVIRYEDLIMVAEGFRLPDGVMDGKNIHESGSDAPAGYELAPAGTVIDHQLINLLATCGYAAVSVRKLPRITIVATGDELVPVGAVPGPQQIRMSNAHQLRALLSHLSSALPIRSELPGASPAIMHLRDDREELRGRVRELLASNDLLLFSGGVSKGKFDFLPEVLAELDVSKLFHRVAQRPGKPLWVGRTDNCMVFGLPGNPVSSLVGTVNYVLPFLRQNLGQPLVTERRQLGEDVHFAKDLTLFQLVRIDPTDQRAYPVRGAGSGDAASMLRATGVLVLPRAQNDFGTGEWFDYVRF